MVSHASLNEDIVWKHSRDIKDSLSMETCSYLRNITVMRENFKKLSKLLNVSDDSDKVKDLPRGAILMGADIFMLLNSCPASKEESDGLNHLYSFLIHREPWNPTVSGMILYTINHMKKAPKDMRMISQKLLKYFASQLEFQYILHNETGQILEKEIDIPKKLSSVLDRNLFTKVTSHPVHILDKDKTLSPSSLIPFCAFGDDMEAMGIKIKEFDIPVCNSFEAKVRNDQLCYEMDLNKYVHDEKDIENKLKEGLVLIMDLNEDRQLKEFWPIKNDSARESAASIKDKTFEIHLDTISKIW